MGRRREPKTKEVFDTSMRSFICAKVQGLVQREIATMTRFPYRPADVIERLWPANILKIAAELKPFLRERMTEHCRTMLEEELMEEFMIPFTISGKYPILSGETMDWSPAPAVEVRDALNIVRGVLEQWHAVLRVIAAMNRKASEATLFDTIPGVIALLPDGYPKPSTMRAKPFDELGTIIHDVRTAHDTLGRVPFVAALPSPTTRALNSCCVLFRTTPDGFSGSLTAQLGPTD